MSRSSALSSLSHDEVVALYGVWRSSSGLVGWSAARDESLGTRAYRALEEKGLVRSHLDASGDVRAVLTPFGKLRIENPEALLYSEVMDS